MTSRGLLPYLGLGVLLLVIGVAFAGFLAPAMQDSRDAVAAARLSIPEFHAESASLCGSVYEESLKSAREFSDGALRDAKAELAKHTTRLRRWFPRLNLVQGTAQPARDLFKSNYEFYLDDLVREVTRLVKDATGRDLREVPLAKPAFLQENRLPKDIEEMVSAQRDYNLLRLLLVAAAAHGGAPVRGSRMTSDWAAFDVTRSFRETEVDLYLEAPDQHVGALLRAVLDLDGEGPIVRLLAVETISAPLPERLPTDYVPTVFVNLRVKVTEYLGALAQEKKG